MIFCLSQKSKLFPPVPDQKYVLIIWFHCVFRVTLANIHVVQYLLVYSSCSEINVLSSYHILNGLYDSSYILFLMRKLSCLSIFDIGFTNDCQ